MWGQMLGSIMGGSMSGGENATMLPSSATAHAFAGQGAMNTGGGKPVLILAVAVVGFVLYKLIKKG
jgi:hypothetical protein